MRSRYTAYTLGEITYIRKSQSDALNNDFSTPQVKKWARNATWTGLCIHEVEKGGVDDDEGWVTFTATYRDQNGKQQIHERSRFIQTQGQWYYMGIDSP